MYPKYHIFYGLILAGVLYFFFGFSVFACLIVFLSSFLFDVDHYLNYVFKNRDFSLKKAYVWNVKRGLRWRKFSYSEKQQHKIAFFMFHGIEFMILLLILAYFHVFFFWVFLGVLFHMVLDYIDIFYQRDLWYSKFSEIYILVRNKKKKEFE